MNIDEDHCLHDSIIEENGKEICMDCGLEIRTITQATFNPSISFKQVIFYTRENNFRKIIERYLCNEIFRIKPPHMLMFTEKFVDKKIQKNQLYDFIRKVHKRNKELKFDRNYKHVNLIYYFLTDYRPARIPTDIEDKIIGQFNIISDKFTELDIPNKNFISYQLVLFTLLVINKQKVNIDDFKMLKNQERLIKHTCLLNYLMKLCFDISIL